MEHRVFVYGTLKAGFRNFRSFNRGTRVPGEFITVQPYALLVHGQLKLPWLVEDAAAARAAGWIDGDAERVLGEVYAVDDEGLAHMDQLELVDEPGWYERRRIAVQPFTESPANAPELSVWVYFGSLEGLGTAGEHLGPLRSYTRAHQDLLAR